MSEVPVAFPVARHEQPAVEIVVNFGVLAGRAATPAEIDRLAEWLLDEVSDVTIVAEERHEIDSHAEASVHLVRVQIADVAGADRFELEERLVARAEHWARVCAAERHLEPAQL